MEDRGRFLASAKRALCVLVLVGVGGCCKQKQEPVGVGSEVEAPWGNGQRMAPATVTDLYGKLAHVRLDDGEQGWVLLSELDPPGQSGSKPNDPCGVAKGDRVMAPFSKTGKKYAGRIAEVYGKLALVQFDDGDRRWSACDQVDPVEK